MPWAALATSTLAAATDNELAANVEVALTRKDEFGRIMTPKEAFRQLCYRLPRHQAKPEHEGEAPQAGPKGAGPEATEYQCAFGPRVNQAVQEGYAVRQFGR
jgi:hypothetical protein